MRKKRKGRAPLHQFFIAKSTSSKIQELRIRDDVGGRRAQVEKRVYAETDRGDVEHERFMIEAKQTIKNRFSLTRKILAKIDKEAFEANKVPAVAIEFTGEAFNADRHWAVIPPAEFTLKSHDFLLQEVKTDKKSLGLSDKVFRALDKEATGCKKIPSIDVEFENPRFGTLNRWYVIPYSEFLKIAKGDS